MICFNFASRSRPKKFFECLDNIRQFISDKDYFVLAKLDNNDIEIEQYKARLNDYPEVVPVFGISQSKIHAINRGLDGVKFDILCNHSDDMFFIMKGFDILIKEYCQDDTFIHFPDAKTTLCTYSIMDKIYFSRFNYVYNPAYRNLWCDNEAMEVAQRLGRYKFVDEKILEHRHPAYGLAARDMQYRKTESTYWIDKATFDKRKLRNFV
jgi:hypothetical protein